MFILFKYWWKVVKHETISGKVVYLFDHEVVQYKH